MSSQLWRKDWAAEKCRLANRLSLGDAGGGYAEAAILTCAILSAFAAELWPGINFDRARFVELLVRYGNQTSECKKISTPLLVQHLAVTSRILDAQRLQRAFAIPDKSYVVSGFGVDQNEEAILQICPHLTSRELRSFSYAALLYREVRSSYMHEYKLGKQADSSPMIPSLGVNVSYVNQLSENVKIHRLIHFHFEWLESLAIEIASVIDGYSSSLPFQQPEVWWLNGG